MNERDHPRVGALDRGLPSRFTTILSTDLDRSERFYEALGFVRHPRSGSGMLWYDRPPRGVLVVADVAAIETLLGFEPGRGAGVMLSLDLDSEAEVDDRFAAGRDAGGSERRTPGLMPWGAYAGWLADPDGFLWEIGFHPRDPFDEDGRLRPPA